ncbi:MAG: hypothetical protein WCF57_09570 [Pyrinomonadaceae bacterium]
MKDFILNLLISIVSGATTITIVAFIGNELFKNVLGRKLEAFKNELSSQAKARELALISEFDKQLEAIRHELGVDAKTRELTLKSQIEFKERQLAEFYGPIYALLKRGDPIIKNWKLGRLKDVGQQIKVKLIKANNQIEEIILNRSHLIEGDEISDSFIGFLTHVTVLHAYVDAGYEVVPLSKEQFPEAYFNEDFANEIFRTTISLKRELHDLYIRYGLFDSNTGIAEFAQTTPRQQA